jgi:arylsulfatase A-like enzyme
VRRAAAVCCSAVVAVALVVACGRSHRVAAEIESEEVVTDLSAALGPVTSRVLLHAAPKAPGRLAYVATPGTPIRTRLSVPPGTALTVEFGLGVTGPPQPAAPVRFHVDVDGKEVLSEPVDPGSERRHRRWHARRVDLAPWAGRDVDVVLGADVAGAGAPVGTPAWTRLELVRVHRAERQRATADAPNVILVLVDTLRSDVLGCYGAAPSRSPTLDALAKTGLVYEDVVAQAPWTLPSVTTLFTGRYPRQHGVTVALADRPHADWDGGTYLPTTIPTLAALAQRAGITTHGVTANALVGPDTGLAVGFEKLELPSPPGGGRRFASGREVNKRFLRWANDNRDLRFFAYLHYMEMHSPYVPAAPPAPPANTSDEVRAGDAGNIGRRVQRGAPAPDAHEVAHLKALYEESLADWDSMLAELLQELDGLRLRDHSIVIVTADHGEEFLEHGQLAHGKQLFDESLHVPLVVVGPGIPVGRRREPVQLVDLLPTIAAQLDAPAPTGLVGRDVVGSALPAVRPFARSGGVGFGATVHARDRPRPPGSCPEPGGQGVALFHLGVIGRARSAAGGEVMARPLARRCTGAGSPAPRPRRRTSGQAARPRLRQWRRYHASFGGGSSHSTRSPRILRNRRSIQSQKAASSSSTPRRPSRSARTA